MTQITSDITTVLKENGYSVTRQRLYVFDLLTKQESLTMHELYELARSGLDRASLYRTIALFEELGIVSRINIGWKYKIELSDKFSEHHHHLTCLKCQAVIAISEDELEVIINQLASSYGFRPIEHQIEMQGYCQNCQAETTTSAA